MNHQRLTGVWIDRKKAVIVTFSNGDKSVLTLESGMEGQERTDGETDQQSRFGKQSVNDERTKERRMEKEFTEYLHKVAESLTDSDAIALFGPADAKTRLMKVLDSRHDMQNRVRGIKTVDSMSDNQIAALVRTYYNL